MKSKTENGGELRSTKQFRILEDSPAGTITIETRSAVFSRWNQGYEFGVEERVSDGWRQHGALSEENNPVHAHGNWTAHVCDCIHGLATTRTGFLVIIGFHFTP